MERATADFQQLAEGLQAARQNSTGPSGMLGGGYAKAPVQQAVTLSTIMGRLQASIDQLDGMIKSAGASVTLLVGPQVADKGYAEKPQSLQDEGTLILADRLLDTLGHRLSELQGLDETIARRLS